MRLKRSWFLAIIGLLLLTLGGIVAFGLALTALSNNEGTTPLALPKDEAMRRAAQRERIAEDFKQIAKYFQTHRAETKKPTSLGFWTYLDRQEGARTICGYIKEQQYAIQVPVGGVGVLAYERDVDQFNTRVVVMVDGTVHKTMPEAEFRDSILKGKR